MKIFRVFVIQCVILFVLTLILIICIEIKSWIHSASLPPNDIFTVSWGNSIKNNHIGFREKEFSLEPLKGGFRIMVLGDSLTWGAGLSESERYSNLLETHLKEEFPNKEIEVLNYGVGGGPTVWERDILRKFYKSLKPNLDKPEPKMESRLVQLSHEI